jgi:hypothetical protein
MHRYSNRISFTFAVLALLSGLTGCARQEAPAHAAYPGLIRGEWTLHSAYRNEGQTHVLDGTFFQFMEEGLMNTNLPLPGHLGQGEDQSTPYDLRQDSLVMHTSQGGEQIFLIGALDSHRMVLSTMILDHAFRFDLLRNH